MKKWRGRLKLLDVNIWIALALDRHAFHQVARLWWVQQRTPRDIAFCRVTQLSFLRLLTTETMVRQYVDSPFTNTEVWSMYDKFLASDRVIMLEEPPGLEGIWRNLTERPTASSKMWADAYLAAFAIAGGHTLVTTDKGFRQYAKLKVIVLS